MENTVITDLEYLTQEATFRYGSCKPEELEKVDKILFGNISFDDLPTFKSNVVRVYLSSMFTGKNCLESGKTSIFFEHPDFMRVGQL
jgi:hypothetical protein